MTTNVLVVEVGQEVVITTTTVDDNNAPIDPVTCKFYLEAPDGSGPTLGGDSPDVTGPGVGVRKKYYTLTQRGTYGLTVRTTAPITVKSVNITTDWNAA